MATTTLNYLGKTDKGYMLFEAVYTVTAIETYTRAARIPLTFTGLSRVVGVIGVHGLVSTTGNVGNPVIVSSVSGRVVTLMALEAGAAAAALDEKTNAEAYGVAGSFRCMVYGL